MDPSSLHNILHNVPLSAVARPSNAGRRTTCVCARNDPCCACGSYQRSGQESWTQSVYLHQTNETPFDRKESQQGNHDNSPVFYTALNGHHQKPSNTISLPFRRDIPSMPRPQHSPITPTPSAASIPPWHHHPHQLVPRSTSMIQPSETGCRVMF